jgi:hypothetical protein
LIGLELPVNVLVIILVAVIVLFSITALYFSGWISQVQTVNIEVAKNDACRRLLTVCSGQVNLVIINNFDADKDGKLDEGIGIGDCGNSTVNATAQDNLYMLCQCYYNANESECRDLCMCKGSSISNPGPPPLPCC